jgi:ABC-type transporter Mla subunit MlaD
MSLIGLGMNLILAVLLACALALGLRLNRRLKALRDSHDGFAVAVRELNAAAERAEQGLADLRAATDEAVDTLADRIEKGRALASKLERLITDAPRHAREAPARDAGDDSREKRLGALLAAAREARAAPAERPLTIDRNPAAAAPQAPRPRPRPAFEDDLFDDPPLRLHQGGRP